MSADTRAAEHEGGNLRTTEARRGRSQLRTAAGLDPDRASFTAALQIARDQLSFGADINSDVLLGTIGQEVLATLLPSGGPAAVTGSLFDPARIDQETVVSSIRLDLPFALST
jgi:hypothetical protein